VKSEEYEKMRRAETRFWWFVGKGRLIEDWAGRWFRSGGDYLDAGCGTGANLSRLSGLGRWWGLDSESAALGFSSGLGHGSLVQGDVCRLPFSESGFDGALALDLFEHLDDDRSAALELFRVLRPGACLLVTVPCYPWLFGAHDLAMGHLRRYRRRELHSLLCGAGFEVERLTHFMGLLFPLFLAGRLWQKFFGDRERTISYDWPGCLNRIFLSILKLETAWLRVRDMPAGTTLAAAARKPLR